MKISPSTVLVDLSFLEVDGDDLQCGVPVEVEQFYIVLVEDVSLTKQIILPFAFDDQLDPLSLKGLSDRFDEIHFGLFAICRMALQWSNIVASFKQNNCFSCVDMPNNESLFAGQLREIVILLSGLLAVDDSTVLHLKRIAALACYHQVYSGNFGELID